MDDRKEFEGTYQGMLAAVGAAWGWVLAFGLLTLIIGILVVTWPSETLTVAAWLFGLQLFITGVFRIVVSFSHDAEGSRGMLVFLGILSVIVGVILLRHPSFTVAILGLFLGIYWIVSGIIDVVAAISAKTAHRGWMAFAGVLSFIAGVVVVAYPSMSLSVLIWFLGIWLLILGVVQIVGAFRLRSAAKSAAAAA